MRSPLVWTGSKRWQVEHVRALLDGFDLEHVDGWDTLLSQLLKGQRRLVEPFAGGASISLGLEARVAVLNDANPALANFWRWLQVGHPLQADPVSYDQLRADFNLCQPDGPVQAARFYELNHRCFNGLWRVNAAGRFNVPARPGDHRSIPPLDAAAYAALMRDWEVTGGDFMDTSVEPGDVIYADPPYDDAFADYASGGFTWADQQRLAGWLAYHPGPVIVANAATRRVQELYASFGFALTLFDDAATQRWHHSRGRTDRVLELLATKGC